MDDMKVYTMLSKYNLNEFIVHDMNELYIYCLTRESRGFAFVRFHDQRDADDAMDGLDGRQYDGRDLR